MKRPSFQFYPSDWLRDTALRTCSVGARGLWMDMICFMHEGTPYGHLKVNNKVILPDNLARMVGETLDTVEGYLLELCEAGVFEYDDDGAIFSRRMVKDESIRNARADGGKKGGNPLLIANKDNHKVNHKVEVKVKQKTTPSSSSSSSSSNNKYWSAEQTIPDGFESFWDAYGKKKGKQNAINQWKRIKPDAELAELITKKAKAYADFWREVKFRKDPERWLHGRHWEDELPCESPVDEFMAGAI